MSSTNATEPPKTADAGRPDAAPTPVRRTWSLGPSLERLALPALLAAVVLFFSLLPASRELFPTPANISVVLGNQSVVLLVAVALLFPLVTGNFDFSVGATAVFASVVCAAGMARFHVPAWQACLLALAAGLVIGTINGVLVSRLQMNSFVSTLGMATLLAGLIQWYSGGLAIIGIDPDLTSFGSSSWWQLPKVVYVVVLAVVAAWYVFTQTPFGRSLYAIGSNGRAATLVGIPKARYTMGAFMISGVGAALAGVILSARTGGANPGDGTHLLFPALTAAFLGTTGFQPGRFNVPGTVVGVLFVAASVSGLTLSGAQNWVDQVFNGLALVVAVGLSSYLGRRRRGPAT